MSRVNSSEGTDKNQVKQGKGNNILHDMLTPVHSSSLTSMKDCLPVKNAAMPLSTTCQL